MRVGALVQGVLDINGASPRRYFFEVLHHFATAELELDRLEYFATPAGRDDLYTYNQKEGVWTEHCKTAVTEPVLVGSVCPLMCQP